MAIGTYAELGTAVTNFSHRTDMATFIDDFIALTEEMIYNGTGAIPPLRVLAMEETVASGLPTLPSDFLEAIRLQITYGGQNSVLDFIPPSQFGKLTDVGGQPVYFTILDSQIQTMPSAAALTYQLDYYKKFPTLDGTNTTNWILTNAPTVYLYGCLMHLARMARDAEGEALALRSFGAAMTALQTRDRAAKTRGGPLTVRAE